MIRFKNREEAGQRLSEKLGEYRSASDTIVIGLPRGGVVVASEVAKLLNLPLDVIVTRKIGAPHQPELALGALTQDGQVILDAKLMAMVDVTREDLEQIIDDERQELQRRLALYRAGKVVPHAEVDLAGKVEHNAEARLSVEIGRSGKVNGKVELLNLEKKTVILVDDGLATGATMRAAITSARNLGAFKVVVAIPIAPSETVAKIKQLADEVVCLDMPEIFWGVGAFYEFFDQVSDHEVVGLLRPSTGSG